MDNLYNFACRTFESILVDSNLNTPKKRNIATKVLLLDFAKKAELLLEDAFKDASLSRPQPTGSVTNPWKEGRLILLPKASNSASSQLARTISRRLVANGLHSCRPLRRLPLTPPNRRQRLEWCRARSTWMTEWHRVVFSDESRFCLSSDSRRVRVWRRRGERSNPAAIGTMTAQRYVDDVLRPVTLPYLQGVRNALYQQDNARPHTARISQQALQDVQMLPWPPYSPDLSPIEHVWDIIGRRLHALPQPRSEDELWQMESAFGMEVWCHQVSKFLGKKKMVFLESRVGHWVIFVYPDPTGGWERHLESWSNGA
ncbi:hypothetical protein LAZ67_4003750 [Cordylochernes scorpioides]|uniref:Transposable element Tc1 transposase n=1 Tax=Cordylochernes scorpioides TaxID=51811 RepID=A0ABY6KDY0_9ARAC|nr:hypothetical protein LAZ67_4003750 [Cordylochernes scorpioides]